MTVERVAGRLEVMTTSRGPRRGRHQVSHDHWKVPPKVRFDGDVELEFWDLQRGVQPLDPGQVDLDEVHRLLKGQVKESRRPLGRKS